MLRCNVREAGTRGHAAEAPSVIRASSLLRTRTVALNSYRFLSSITASHTCPYASAILDSAAWWIREAVRDVARSASLGEERGSIDARKASNVRSEV